MRRRGGRRKGGEDFLSRGGKKENLEEMKLREMLVFEIDSFCQQLFPGKKGEQVRCVRYRESG